MGGMFTSGIRNCHTRKGQRVSQEKPACAMTLVKSNMAERAKSRYQSVDVDAPAGFS